MDDWFEPYRIKAVEHIPITTREERRAALELVRISIPRRVYTSRHLSAVARSVADVLARRDGTRGLEMVFEPRYLRFFQARFRPLPA